MPKNDWGKALEIAHSIRKFEINLLWKRAWFFWGFTLAGFTAYAFFYKNSDYQTALLVANFGLISAFIWTLVNRGSKFWQDFWDKRIKEIEPKVLGKASFFQKIPPPEYRGVWSGARFSPSRLIIALSDYVFVAWLSILFIQAGVVLRYVPEITLVGILAFITMFLTIVFMFCMAFETLRHYDKK